MRGAIYIHRGLETIAEAMASLSNSKLYVLGAVSSHHQLSDTFYLELNIGNMLTF